MPVNSLSKGSGKQSHDEGNKRKIKTERKPENKREKMPFFVDGKK